MKQARRVIRAWFFYINAERKFAFIQKTGQKTKTIKTIENKNARFKQVKPRELGNNNKTQR